MKILKFKSFLSILCFVFLDTMTSVKALNPAAETMAQSEALMMNVNAAKGLYDVMKTNLGPKGTIKMLVGGAGGHSIDPSYTLYKALS